MALTTNNPYVAPSPLTEGGVTSGTDDGGGYGQWWVDGSGESTIESTSGSIPSGGGGGGMFLQTTPSTAPVANFTYTIYADGYVTFVNKSTGSISAYSWSFGDGKASLSPSVLHQYVGSGTFTVTLRVVNAAGASTYTQLVTIDPTPLPTTVDFTYVVGALAVQCTDISTASGMRTWNFGDGQISYDINPYHVYASNGIYAVTLTINGISKTSQVVIDRGVRLDWQDNSSDEDGFEIEWSPTGTGDWTQIATTGVGVNSLLVTLNIHGIDPTALNYFRVRAYNGVGDSGYSNTIASQCS